MTHSTRIRAAYWSNSAAPARAGAVRRLSGPASPAACTNVLAPCRFRVPDLNPSKSKRLRSGTLHLCYTSKQTTGETNTETHWGNTRNPPGPENHGPVPGFPQTPIPASPDKRNPPHK
jgi:hypothetical protein